MSDFLTPDKIDVQSASPFKARVVLETARKRIWSYTRKIH
ncbi:MAG: hypothetical protein Ct9H90mP27_0620 [Gammaproteobacteria bacterium]|nr:MAG: hypothetical protein Ct9H90mP27_0620 [Gammaproteobacteria bacterium]